MKTRNALKGREPKRMGVCCRLRKLIKSTTIGTKQQHQNYRSPFVFLAVTSLVLSLRVHGQSELRYNCSDNAKVAAALRESVMAFRGVTRLAYKVNMDNERFILKTSHLKENFVRIHNLTQEKVHSMKLYDKGKYKPAKYIQEYAILRKYRGPGVPVVEGFCQDPSFTWILLENAHPLRAGFIEYPTAKQSLLMVQSLSKFFLVHQLHGFGHDMSVTQFAYTQDWRLNLVDVDPTTLKGEMEYLKWNLKAVKGIKCEKNYDCVDYVKKNARRFGGHKECDTFTCKAGKCMYSRQFIEKDTVCVVGETIMKRLVPFGFPPAIVKQCTGTSNQRPSWSDLKSRLDRMVTKLDACEKSILDF